MTAQGRRGLIVEKEGPALSPQPIDRNFLAALLRRQADAQNEYIRRSEIEAELESARHDERENLAASRDAQVEAAQRLADALTKTITDFEKASGIAIRDWRGSARIGAAVRLVLSPEWKNEEERLWQVAREYRAIAKRIEEAVGVEPQLQVVEEKSA